MDESKVKTICDRNSVYISLKDQANVNTVLQCPRRPVSKERKTRIHFVVNHEVHYAAVQLSICPFDLPFIPKQKFFQCSFRWTQCCESAPLEDISREVLRAVQRIYDCYYHPTQWDFSSEHCCINDRTQHATGTTCAKNTETALIGYIQREASFEGDCEVNNSSGRLRNGIKRRRLDTFNDANHHRTHNRNTNDKEDADEEHCATEGNDGSEDRNNNDAIIEDAIIEQERPKKGNDGSESRNDDDMIIADERPKEGNDGSENRNDGDAIIEDERPKEGNDGSEDRNDGDMIIADEQPREDKAVAAILKKIQRGLLQVIPAKNGKNLHPQGGCTNMLIKGRAAYNEVIPPDFFARDENSLQDRSLLLENFLWQQSKSVFRNAREISWKCSFLAACLRKLRDPITSGLENDPSNATSYRWLMAVQMINTIVDGLWLAWGPKAALIYEALAAKNYSLSLIVGLAQSSRSKIIQRVINALKNSAPDIPLEVHVFHPAACVNSALNIDYKKTCVTLNLENSFLKVNSLQCLQSHTTLSLLSFQWDRYLATLQADPATSSPERGRLNVYTGFVDAPTAVNVTEIQSSVGLPVQTLSDGNSLLLGNAIDCNLPPIDLNLPEYWMGWDGVFSNESEVDCIGWDGVCGSKVWQDEA
ncbi:hypothetical protein OCU04_002439 [Sclerotinia nivalis]|uniref:Uncharacterized protein n=1 Tax=Sclerotinia nivalis TaxID=352851 RepID=A0A9X0ATM1_9HELO|nr:hypothetical protein OCU04_002439 [Sclerotinia nivalis]